MGIFFALVVGGVWFGGPLLAGAFPLLIARWNLWGLAVLAVPLALMMAALAWIVLAAFDRQQPASVGMGLVFIWPYLAPSITALPCIAVSFLRSRRRLRTSGIENTQVKTR